MPGEPVELFLILAHEDPTHLTALLRKLLPRGTQDKAIVHIDAKSRLWKETRGLFLRDIPNVRVIERPVAVRWGHESMVAATALLLKAALQEQFSLAHLMSGADWPVKSKADRLRSWNGTSMVEAVCGVQSSRMGRYALYARFIRFFDVTPAGRRLWRIRACLNWLENNLPERVDEPWGPWHKGSQWWSLTSAACAFLLPEIYRALRSGRLFATLCADEHLIQTIMANQQAHPVTRVAKRAIIWTGRASPRVLTAADWPSIAESDAWFARKLSRAIDPFFLSL